MGKRDRVQEGSGKSLEELRAVYDGDTKSKRFKKFALVSSSGFVGTIYCPADLKKINKVTVSLIRPDDDDYDDLHDTLESTRYRRGNG